jgi:branched-chain amino acid transport system permease protein
MAYIIHLLILISIYAILGLSLNLVVGYTGLLSVAEAAFYGIGAYVTALLLVNSGWNFFLAMLIGMIASGVVALVIGFVLSKFDGDYYALASLGLGAIIYSIFLNWQNVTGGPLGIPGIPRPTLFGFTFSDNISFLVLVVIFVALIYLACRFIVNSSFGRVLKTIREDEKAVQVFGYKTLNYKLLIFVISAMIAAIAGSFYAAYISYIDPSTFTVDASILIIAIIILGGLASLRGSLIGAVFIILLPEFLRFVGFPDAIAAQMRQAVYGLLLILLMLYRPQGFVGEYKL